MEQKITPALAKSSLNVVPIDSLSNTASTATPADEPLVQWHAEFLVCLKQLGINLVEALRAVAFFFGAL